MNELEFCPGRHPVGAVPARAKDLGVLKQQADAVKARLKSGTAVSKLHE